VTGGLIVDHERIFLYGTSHGGQTAMTAAHALRALGDANPMNADLPEDFDRRRYAAFFDYYGGCGLFGAYGGADSGSTWRPYGPFLMLHGENDDIWKVQETGTVREQWLNSECKPRIDAAKADPSFDTFLETIIYANADHSFDGVKRTDFNFEGDGEFPDWLAKVHANYRITVPFMEAIGRQVAAARNNETVPSLTELGFSDQLSYFDTFPLNPSLGPQAVPGNAIDTGTSLLIENLGESQIDLATLLADPFQFFDMTCDIADAPAFVTETGECVIDFTLTQTQIDSELPTAFWIRAYTQRGVTMIPATLVHSQGSAGELAFGQPFYSLRNGEILNSEYGNAVNLAVEGFAWSRFGRADASMLQATLTPPVTGYTIDAGLLAGPVPAPPGQSLSLQYFSAGDAISIQLSVIDLGGGVVSVQQAAVMMSDLDNDLLDTPALPVADFATNFEPLAPVSGAPGDGDDDDSGDDDSGDDDSGDDDSGDDDSGDDNSGDDDDGNRNGIPNPGSSSGGGALFWLLPFALLFRRR
ncbi:MAG TPA: hypothetical protein VF267_09900, partial [Gammaproteobacteria bacterium]